MMRMKSPAHPGAVIKSELEELRVSVSAAAKALGVSRQQLHNVIAGRSAVSAEMAVRLEQGLGSTAETWLRLQANHDLAMILDRGEPIRIERIVPKVAAE